MMDFSAFSTVIANIRYVSLGLVLMGVLAGVNRFVGGEPEKVVKKGKAVVEKVVEVKRWDEYAVSLEDFGEAVKREGVEVNMGEAVKEVETDVVVLGDDAASSAVKEDTATVKSEETITLTTTESERTVKLTAKVEKAIKKKKKKAIEDLSPPPQESPSSLAQRLSAPAFVPPSRSISPERKLKRSKKDEPEPGKKKKKRKKRDEIDDLFAGL
ncbi:hypothetical protein L873DRAFT_827399 [Choiromyces venosus 120613-1]|uniref:Uncharacterized protein n=1 Tax=Choiromyces venosus 120613-1 TaxID=1336337 RepID=A0A3N4JPJ6_9PEZI|nr:hypothetical protein L873DRAFT_827399 [Choiromyces venosus 120613-1]